MKTTNIKALISLILIFTFYTCSAGEALPFTENFFADDPEIEQDKAKLIDCYTYRSADDEEARLDNMVVKLNASMNAKGYIIRYRGKKTTLGQFRARRTRLSQWLFDIRKIGRDRVTIVSGGERTKDTTELWIVPAGADAPSSSSESRCRTS
ncbi:MAG TPA: hypothetical protein VGO50_13910 [Pyrinomonadaceae bacterium]|jgi:hypothetical protein|nr:hypothetical protein [Pyrinomonadaceae bacterium]